MQFRYPNVVCNLNVDRNLLVVIRNRFVIIPMMFAKEILVAIQIFIFVTNLILNLYNSINSPLSEYTYRLEYGITLANKCNVPKWTKTQSSRLTRRAIISPIFPQLLYMGCSIVLKATKRQFSDCLLCSFLQIFIFRVTCARVSESMF